MAAIKNWVKSTNGKIATAYIGNNGRGGYVFTAEIKDGPDDKFHAYLWTSHAIFYGQYDKDTSPKTIAEELRQEAIAAAKRILEELED